MLLNKNFEQTVKKNLLSYLRYVLHLNKIQKSMICSHLLSHWNCQMINNCVFSIPNQILINKKWTFHCLSLKFYGKKDNQRVQWIWYWNEVYYSGFHVEVRSSKAGK